MTKEQYYKNEAERLWEIIDNISTLGDIVKPDGMYFKLVEKEVKKYNKEIYSDGYKLYWRLF